MSVAVTSVADWQRLVAVYHQLKVDRATPLIAVVEDVLRPRFALDVDQDTRWK